MRSPKGLVVVAVLLFGCSEKPLPCASGKVAARYTLSAPGVTVEVETSPFRYTVKDAHGTGVLSSAGAGTHDGYGTVGFTRGSLFWGNDVSPGYFTLDSSLEPWRDDWRVVAASQTGDGTLALTLASPNDSACLHATVTLRASTVRVESKYDGAQPRAWSAGFASPLDEAFMGFGERFNRIDQRGRALYSWTEEGGLGKSEATPKGPVNPWPNGETMTYYPIPFFLSSRGYGFWLDSTWRNQFELASEKPDAWRVWDVGPTLAYEIYVPIPDDARPWPYQLVDLFTATTGRPMIPPDWTFGPRRRIGRGNQVNGVPEIKAMRDQDLAITAVDDALHFLPAGSDVGIETDLGAWTENAKRLGYRVNGYYNPYISKDPSPLDPLAQVGLSQRYFLHTGDGAPSVVWLISGKFLNLYTIDMTNADATAWFVKQFDRAFNLGYSGWMYDFGEYVQPDVVASNGMSGEQLHNLFPVLYDKAVHDALEAGPHAGDWLAFARAGYTGSSQYIPMVWSGDPDASFDDALGLPAMVRGGINMGLSGVAHWGSDIGGFKCGSEGHAGANGELLARWIEYGALGSNMQDQDACADAMDDGEKANLWSAPEAKAAWKTYARLHTRLYPYLRALADDAHATGAPTMRALFLEHPTAEYAQVDDEYYLGPALLVAPVVHRGATTRELVLPPGRFVQVYAPPSLLAGPARLTVDAPLDRLPLYLREGQLLPLLDPTIDTLADENDATIVGPKDVADRYDVMGLLTGGAPSARVRLHEGGALSATVGGAFAPPTGLTLAANEAELATCAGCYLVESVADMTRVRVSATGDVQAGGLTLASSSARRTRWDLYLQP